MLFVLIAFTAILLIYSAIVAAVWWLPKDAAVDANSPAVEKDEPLPANQRALESILRLITGVYALLLIPASLIAIFAPFSMAGSGDPQGKFVAFLFMATFPFTITGAMIVAWILFRRRQITAALLVTVLPIVQIVVSYFVPGIWSSL